LIAGLAAFFFILGSVFVSMLRDWEIPDEWIRNTANDLASGDETIVSSIGLGALAGNIGGFMGASTGALFLHRRGGFDALGQGWKRVVRSVAGLLILFAFYGVFNLISPDKTKVALYSVWRFSGFFAISFSAIFLVPLFLMRINLCTKCKDETIERLSKHHDQ
jgi:hypothetical protein